MNRRNFFSKFSLLAFFVPFIPKLKSFLYDKNLEDKPIIPKVCDIINLAVYSSLANHPYKISFWATYKKPPFYELRIYYENEKGLYDEIYNPKKHEKFLLGHKPNPFS